MPSKANRTTEHEIGEATLRILATRPNGEGSIEDIKKQIPNEISLTADDQAPSLTRNGEELWEQQVRNLTSHHDVPGNIIFEGYAERIDGGFRITDAGRRRVT